MTTHEVGREMVQLCSTGRSLDAFDSLYSKEVVSIQSDGTDGPAPYTKGLEDVRGLSVSWFESYDLHSEKATGPFLGPRDDQFIALIEIDASSKETGERSQSSLVVLYTVADGKIVREELFSHMP